jgi:hypothetical protein
MSPKQNDVRTRVDELAATVRGLTQELVEANERIRQLEAALEGGDDGRSEDASDGGARADGNRTEGSTKQMGGPDQTDEETPSDLDDIIVA